MSLGIAILIMVWILAQTMVLTKVNQSIRRHLTKIWES